MSAARNAFRAAVLGLLIARAPRSVQRPLAWMALGVGIVVVAIILSLAAHAGPEAAHRGHWVAPGQWQMNDIGRNHGVVGGAGIPKCNPWVSPECARLHPSLFNKVPKPGGRP